MLCLISASFTGCLEDDNYDTVTDTTDDSTSDDITDNTENTSETDNENKMSNALSIKKELFSWEQFTNEIV